MGRSILAIQSHLRQEERRRREGGREERKQGVTADRAYCETKEGKRERVFLLNYFVLNH
jgi:hypothetical protein